MYTTLARTWDIALISSIPRNLDQSVFHHVPRTASNGQTLAPLNFPLLPAPGTGKQERPIRRGFIAVNCLFAGIYKDRLVDPFYITSSRITALLRS